MNGRDPEFPVAVAEELHFGRAAERRHASQPALKHYLPTLRPDLVEDVTDRLEEQLADIIAGIVPNTAPSPSDKPRPGDRAPFPSRRQRC